MSVKLSKRMGKHSDLPGTHERVNREGQHASRNRNKARRTS